MTTVPTDEMSQTLPLGRKLIRLTVEAPSGAQGPKRGYRRIAWIEKAIEPIRPKLTPSTVSVNWSGVSSTGLMWLL